MARRADARLVSSATGRRVRADQCFTFGNLVGPALPAVDGKVTRIRPAQPALQRITDWPCAGCDDLTSWKLML